MRLSINRPLIRPRAAGRASSTVEEVANISAVNFPMTGMAMPGIARYANAPSAFIQPDIVSEGRDIPAKSNARKNAR